MRRYPAGVAVVTVDVGGQRVGLTVASLVSLSLEPPLVGVAVARQAALHELLREAGGFAVSLLGADQEALAQHFARGVPPIAMWAGSTSERATGRRCSPAPSAGCGARVAAEHDAGDHTLFVGRVERAEPGRRRAAARAPRRRVPVRVIDAVVFDLDGVLLDSEQVWDDVREQLARERGGRWREGAQADMMGMSSPEWSRYMHERSGSAESPEEINDEVVRRHARALPRAPAAAPRRGRGGERLAARWPLGLASSSNRPLIDAVLETRRDRELLRGDRLVGGGRARQAGAGRLPRGGAPPRRRAGALRGGRGLGERHPRRPRRRHARGRDPERALPAAGGRARAGGRRARLARRADAGARSRTASGDRRRAEQDAAVVAAEAHRVRERDVEPRPGAPRSARSRGRTPGRGSGS